MSYYYENTWFRIVTGQVYIVIYSLLAAWLGIGWKTFAVIMILIIATTVLQGRIMKGRQPGSKVSPDDVMKSRKLYEEKNLREIQSKDEGLIEDMRSQLKLSTYMFAGTFVGLAYFWIIWPHVPDLHEYLRGFIDNGFIVGFLAFLLYLEGFFIISQATIFIALWKVGKVTTLVMPNEYIVTVKGIVYRGLLSNTAIGFPLSHDVIVRFDDKRSLVDIIMEGKRSVNIVRLYSRNPKRLYEIIRRYGLEKES